MLRYALRNLCQKWIAKGNTDVITSKRAADRPSRRQPSTRSRGTSAAAVLLGLGLGWAAAGCGGTDRDEGAFAPVDGTESAYCETYRAWQVHELDGGTGDDQPNPAAFRAYWEDYLEFNKTSLQQAPAEIRDDWIVSDRAIRTVLTPVLEKYDFDVQRIATEGTAAEKALGEPTPRLRRPRTRSTPSRTRCAAWHRRRQRTSSSKPAARRRTTARR